MSLSESERQIVERFGHRPDPSYDNLKLAHRVLELPDVGERSNWYTTSAVTLAAAYIEACAALSQAKGSDL